jgi:hypothetical protein
MVSPYVHVSCHIAASSYLHVATAEFRVANRYGQRGIVCRMLFPVAYRSCELGDTTPSTIVWYCHKLQ